MKKRTLTLEDHLPVEVIEWRFGLNHIFCLCEVPELLEHKDIRVHEPTQKRERAKKAKVHYLALMIKWTPDQISSSLLSALLSWLL